MKRTGLFAIVVVAGAALLGCGTDKRLPSGSGGGLGNTGGTVGSTGGTVGNTGGTAGNTAGTVGSTGGTVGNTGGTVGNTGGTVGKTGGAGGNPAGGGGAGGAPADGGVCASASTVPVNPWTLVRPDAGTPAAAPDGGGSGCQGSGSGYSWKGTCSGGAWLRPGGGSPTVTWDDGSQLVWSTATWQQPIAPPGAAAAETRVWASLIRDVQVVCAFCGSITTNTVEIREAAGGKLLFLAKEGRNTFEPTGDQLMALFGVDANSRPICSLSARDGCTSIQLTINDHLVETTPPQTIPPSVLTTVTAPNGTIQVIWFSSAEQQLGSIPGCYDGIPTGPPLGFLGSRL